MRQPAADERPHRYPDGGPAADCLCTLFAIRHKAPITLFLLCGIFPLVPGAGIYYTAYYFLRDDRTLFANKGVETLKIAVALALGIALVCSIPLKRRKP